MLPQRFLVLVSPIFPARLKNIAENDSDVAHQTWRVMQIEVARVVKSHISFTIRFPHECNKTINKPPPIVPRRYNHTKVYAAESRVLEVEFGSQKLQSLFPRTKARWFIRRHANAPFSSFARGFT